MIQKVKINIDLDNDFLDKKLLLPFCTKATGNEEHRGAFEPMM